MNFNHPKEKHNSLFKLSLAVLTIAIMLSSSAGMGAEKLGKEPVVPLAAADITRMYPHSALKMEGAAAGHEQLPEYMAIRWVGRGSVSWKVNAPKPGDYEVALCYAAHFDGPKLEVAAADSKITGTVHKTKGMFIDEPVPGEKPIDREYLKNYERVHLEGVLHLPAGISTITVRVTEPESGDVMDLRSIELTPVAAKERIAAEQERAIKSRASTDWFADAGYGVMFHWNDGSQPRHGPKKPYKEAVRDFDVEAFVDMVEQTGAGYVVFTLNSYHPHCPAPIASWEKAHPGWTNERDLVGEIADALDEKGIKLIIYMAEHLIGRPDEVDEPEFLESQINVRFEGGGFDEDTHVKILTEFGERYGRKVAGYWFDGWDLIPEQHPSISYERLFKATKVGNPDRIIGLNFWIFPDATLWQEFWAGEISSVQRPATSRYLKYAAGEGLQWHGLFMLEGVWGHGRPDSEMEPPTISAEELIKYVKACMANGGVVSINMGIYQDGTVGEKSLKVMQALREAIKK